MSPIIRATDRNRGVQGVAFNFDDMAGQASRQLDRFRDEAKAIVAKAHQEAGAIRKKAEAEGRQAGIRAVEQMVGKQLATVLPALTQAIREIHDSKHEWQRHWEATAIHVAAAIARRVIRRELSKDPKISLTWVRETLQLAAGSSQLRIRLNPDDHKALGGQVEMLVKELSAMAAAEVVPDPEVTVGGCRVETRCGVIDQQVESQLKRIEEELT